MRISRENYLLILTVVFCHLINVANAQPNHAPKKLRVGYSIPIERINYKSMAYAKAAGIECIETSFSAYVDTIGDLKITETELNTKVNAAKSAADKAGIQIWSVHMLFGKHIDISFPNESERQRVMELHKKILKYCAILKPRIILFHPSWYLELNDREVRKSQMVKSANEMNLVVKSINATMVIENMLGPKLLVDAKRERPLCRTVDETVEIMNMLPDDIYSAIDLNHIENPEKLIYAMGARLKTLHVSDGTGSAENHYFPCSGQGKNNWVAIFKALDSVKYKGPFMYECKYKDVKDFKACYEELYKDFLLSFANKGR